MDCIVHTRACCKALYTMIVLCRRRLQYGSVNERRMYVSRRFYRSEGTVAISYFLVSRQYFSTLEAEKIVRGTRCECIMG